MIAGNAAEHQGGGIYCESSAIELVRCRISENRAGGNEGYGGGIYAIASALTMVDCRLDGNRAESYRCDGCSRARGGGICAESATTITLTRCTFLGNKAIAGNEDDANFAVGGGALLRGANVSLVDCVFRGNEARSLSDPALSRSGNYAYAGALACRAAAIESCEFTANLAYADGNPDGNSGHGGALYAEDVTLATGCIFTDNTATGGGSTPAGDGHRLRAEDRGEGGAAAVIGGARFERCTFSRNSASSAGAAIHVRDDGGGGVASIDNTIIAFSQTIGAVACAGGVSSLLSCSDVFGNAGGDYVGCLAGQLGVSGNIAADPLFCLPAIGNYALEAGSPCAPEQAPAGCGLIGAIGVGCGATGVPAEEVPPVAAAYVRITPNPMAGEASLGWSDAIGGERTARIFDLAGRLVRERDLGRRAPGTHAVAWSEVTGGRRLPAGVYFVEILPRGAGARPARVVVVN